MKRNKIEKLKLQLPPIEYYKDLSRLRKLSERDYFYLKNFGIYSTKQQEEFMLRLRIPAGLLPLDKLSTILRLTRSFDTRILLTARSQMELHGLSLQEAIHLHKELLENGISTFQTLTDNLRNIITDPLDGVGLHSKLAVTPLILKMDRAIRQVPAFVGTLPRKFNVAISGMKASPYNFFAQDCFFALAKKEDRYGFNLYLGGKNNEIAQSAAIFVWPEEVPKLFEAIVLSYMRHGLRESRTKARLFHLIEKIGIERMRELILGYFGAKDPKEGETIQGQLPSAIFYELKDKKFAYKYTTDFGRIEREELREILHFAKANNLSIRLSPDQNIYILGLHKPKVPFERPDHTILACAGSKECIYALFDTKEEASTLPIALLKKHNIQVGYSGCLKGCGRHILADIGLVGIRTNHYGKVERGVRFYLGGGGQRAARMIYWAVPLRKLNDLLSTIVEDFVQRGYPTFRQYCESFLNLHSPKALALYYLTRMCKEEGKIEENDELLKHYLQRCFAA